MNETTTTTTTKSTVTAQRGPNEDPGVTDGLLCQDS